MSAFVKQDTLINDQDLLVEALKKKGYTDVEIHKEPQALVGYQGDTRKEKAEVIIRRKHVGSASNDIGFRKGPDGNYEALISDYDRHKHNADWLTDLKKEYATMKAKKVAKKAGLQLTKETTKNGKTVLQYVVRG